MADGSPQVEADNAAISRGDAGNRRTPYQGVAWEEKGISELGTDAITYVRGALLRESLHFPTEVECFDVPGARAGI